MCLLAFLSSRSSSSGDFVWAIVSIVGLISGSNAWQAAQIAKYANRAFGEEINEKQRPKNQKSEPNKDK